MHINAKTLLVRIIGAIYGALGVVIVIAILYLGYFGLSGKTIPVFRPEQLWIRIPANTVIAILSFAVARNSWGRNPHLAGKFAWFALAVYIFSVLAFIVIDYGHGFRDRLTPPYYYFVLAQAIAAVVLTCFRKRNREELVA